MSGTEPLLQRRLLHRRGESDDEEDLSSHRRRGVRESPPEMCEGTVRGYQREGKTRAIVYQVQSTTLAEKVRYFFVFLLKFILCLILVQFSQTY